MKASDCILFSGGAPGAEAAFGACAERRGIEEVNFTFEGHSIARSRGVRMLNHEELQAGDVSLEYVARLVLEDRFQPLLDPEDTAFFDIGGGRQRGRKCAPRQSSEYEKKTWHLRGTSGGRAPRSPACRSHGQISCQCR